MTASREHANEWIAAMAARIEVVPDEDAPAEPTTDWRPSRMRHSRAPLRAIDCALASPTETPALVAVRELVAVDPRRATTLVLGGRPGSGKTVAATWALGEVSSGRFVHAPDLSRINAYDGEQYDALVSPDMLVIDDLGTEYADKRGFLAALIDSLIDQRHANYRRTIITVNMTAQQFRERYGERVADRIREAGRFVSLSSASMRGEK